MGRLSVTICDIRGLTEASAPQTRRQAQTWAPRSADKGTVGGCSLWPGPAGHRECLEWGEWGGEPEPAEGM